MTINAERRMPSATATEHEPTANGLHIAGLQARRGNFALGPLDLALPAGRHAAVIGASGAGKSTLLRCLAGFERIAGGTIRLDGAVLAGPGIDREPAQRGIGFMFQDGGLWPHLSALQHLRFVAPAWTESQCLELLAEAGLAALRDRRPAQLSGGEAQRLGLVRALANAPRLLLLDEPLRSVDVHLRGELIALLRRMCRQRGLSMLLVTHDRDEALALADHVIVLDGGRLVEQGAYAELQREPRSVFTATFLGGGTALPTQRNGAHALTPFGGFAIDGQAAGELRLVVLPGDVAAAACAPGDAGPRGVVIAMVHSAAGPAAKVELAGQLVPASLAAPLSPGTEVTLRLLHAPRLLPCRPEDHA